MFCFLYSYSTATESEVTLFDRILRTLVIVVLITALILTNIGSLKPKPRLTGNIL